MRFKYKSVTIKQGLTSGFWPLVVKEKHPFFVIKGQLLISSYFLDVQYKENLYKKEYFEVFSIFVKKLLYFSAYGFLIYV